MSKMRLLALVGALICAVVAGVLAKNMLGKRKETVEVKVETVDVLVAVKDFLMGDKLAEGVIWKPFPKEGVTELMITRAAQPDALKDMAVARVKIPVFKDEAIISKKVVMPGAGGFLSASLPKGMRAVAVSVDPRTSAGGFILPNDRVDVILARRVGSGVDVSVKSETVLSNVRVLAINQVYKAQTEGDPNTVKDVATATLELTPNQSEVIAVIANIASANLSLALRSLAENDGKSEAEILPVLADKYSGKKVSGDSMIIRAGVESVAASQ